MDKNLTQEQKVQEIYDKVFDLFETFDIEGEEHEALLVGVTQAIVDKVSSSFEDDFHPYLIKDLGDMMHEFCNEYALSFMEGQDDEEGDSEEESLSEESQGE